MIAHLKIILAMILYVFVASFSSHSMAFDMRHVNHIYFFGDSLLDTGYLDASKNYVPEGQDPIYTTPHGHVAAYYLNHEYNQADQANNMTPPSGNGWVSGRLDGNDYAAGGAVSVGDGIGLDHYHPPSLTYQVNNFLAERKPQPNDVFIIWVGANDIFKTFMKNYSKGTDTLITAELAAMDATTNAIHDAVVKLNDAGAEHIVVLNMPPLGQTPMMKTNPVFKTAGNMMATMFNTALISKLNKLNPKPAIFDVNQTLNTIVAAIDSSSNHTYTEPGTTLTITNDTDPACTTPISIQHPFSALAISCKHWVSTDKMKHYLFADAMHPSDTAHHILAVQLEKFLNTTLMDKKQDSYRIR